MFLIKFIPALLLAMALSAGSCAYASSVDFDDGVCLACLGKVGDETDMGYQMIAHDTNQNSYTYRSSSGNTYSCQVKNYRIRIQGSHWGGAVARGSVLRSKAKGCYHLYITKSGSKDVNRLTYCR